MQVSGFELENTPNQTWNDHFVQLRGQSIWVEWKCDVIEWKCDVIEIEDTITKQLKWCRLRYCDVKTILSSILLARRQTPFQKIKNSLKLYFLITGQKQFIKTDVA